MSKLSVQLVQDHLLRESEEVKAKYSTQKAPDGKSKAVGTPKDLSGKKSNIPQIEVPANHKDSAPKGGKTKGQMGIPQSKRADEIVDHLPVPKTSTAKNEKSPSTPAVKKTKPNQTQKQKEVKNAIKRTEEGKTDGANVIPAADFADKYTAKMGHGSTTLGGKTGKTPTVDAPKAPSLGATTAPARKPASMKTPKTDGQKVTQVVHSGKAPATPSDAPATPKWDKKVKGHNVMESVDVYINGKPKASYGIINRDVAAKLVENYESFGYEVELRRSATAPWKKDRELLSAVYECFDAHYNKAPKTSANAGARALKRFFSLAQPDYNNIYEDRQQFTRTVKAAFERLMEAADLKYRQSLDVMEGIARVEIKGEVHDLDMITQAKDMEMALRAFRNEIVEEYGFNADIKHIFVEGQKFGPEEIVEWSAKK